MMNKMMRMFRKPTEIAVSVTAYIEKDKNGFYAYCPTMPGLHVEGETDAEVKDNVRDAVSAYLLSLVKHNDPLPMGTTVTERPKAELYTFTQYLPKVA